MDKPYIRAMHHSLIEIAGPYPLERVRGDFIARTAGVWRWKRIQLGDRFFPLPLRARQAIIAHERGHADLLHNEKRLPLLLLIPLLPIVLLLFAALEWCRRMEMEADSHAIFLGYGRHLMEWRGGGAGEAEGDVTRAAMKHRITGMLYPSPEESRSNIRKQLGDDYVRGL